MKTPYGVRSDLTRIHSQWTKLTGLHSREEWSGAMVRAATGAELAANYAIREEFRKASQLTPAFVNSLLKSANGLGGKMEKLLLPLSMGTPNVATMRKLNNVAQRINAQRNMIVHQGHFMNESEAQTLIEDARLFIETLVRLYDTSFALGAPSK